MPIDLKSQEWGSIDPNEIFPDLSWSDMKYARHPTENEYNTFANDRHEAAKKKYGFKSYVFDTEQGLFLEDYAEVIESILLLLPSECKIQSVKKFINPENNRWVVSVIINNNEFEFSTQAMGGDWMDTANLFKNLDTILNLFSPDYIAVIPEIDLGQAIELLIERKDEIYLAAQEGFSYPHIKIEWKNSFPKEYYLFIPDFQKIDEDLLNITYIEDFNKFAKDANINKKFHLMILESVMS